jgi:hypothetical protein
MTLAVALFGLFIAALGVAGVLSPERLLALVTRAQSQLGLNLIAGIRLVLGVALLFAAPSSRAPLYLQVLGGLSLVSGAVTPFFGVHRFEAILGWWRRRPPWAVRIWSAFVIVFGLSLVWAVVSFERAA